ncbi:hypothetical protein L204_102651 [Cryptococcus depauperatus]
MLGAEPWLGSEIFGEFRSVWMWMCPVRRVRTRTRWDGGLIWRCMRMVLGLGQGEVASWDICGDWEMWNGNGRCGEGSVVNPCGFVEMPGGISRNVNSLANTSEAECAAAPAHDESVG